MIPATTYQPELCLRVEVPICAFRPYESREYQDTHPVPPPSAIYGMLLSLCGVPREKKDRHAGVALAAAVEGDPERSRVFRKLRRGKDLENIRPDYQDLLVGVRLWIWMATAEDRAERSLPATVKIALSTPEAIKRCGGLSLGESSYLVDSISEASPDDDASLRFIVPDPEGFYSLPVWIDHAANDRRRDRFRIEELPVSAGVARSWVNISRTSRGESEGAAKK
jgi:CRISPR-associated protein Cas5t